MGQLAAARVMSVIAFMEERMTEPLVLPDLAAVAHMSQFHFARLFRSAAGRSPHAYLTWLRVERAKKLLARTDMALVDVAASVGYQTQAHFTGVFHKHVGATPRAYRLSRPRIAAPSEANPPVTPSTRRAT
jgi:AraC family transcriptional regulator